ncbi:hypothetical protein BJ170DRAFT_201145 [Xylariales sp. AK1849]|nr:hypothetical protein BJ170DRAFT_201145 [Xylariales sp. AK1849]
MSLKPRWINRPSHSLYGPLSRTIPPSMSFYRVRRLGQVWLTTGSKSDIDFQGLSSALIGLMVILNIRREPKMGSSMARQSFLPSLLLLRNIFIWWGLISDRNAIPTDRPPCDSHRVRRRKLLLPGLIPGLSRLWGRHAPSALSAFWARIDPMVSAKKQAVLGPSRASKGIIDQTRSER